MSSFSTLLVQAVVSFTNQALKGLPQRYQIDLLEKYQEVTKQDVLDAFRTHFLPLFDASSSVAVVVTAPAKADAISTSLRSEGFEVTQRALEIDPSEMEDDGSSEDGSCESDCDSHDSH